LKSFSFYDILNLFGENAGFHKIIPVSCLWAVHSGGQTNYRKGRISLKNQYF